VHVVLEEHVVVDAHAGLGGVLLVELVPEAVPALKVELPASVLQVEVEEVAGLPALEDEEGGGAVAVDGTASEPEGIGTDAVETYEANAPDEGPKDGSALPVFDGRSPLD